MGHGFISMSHNSYIKRTIELNYVDISILVFIGIGAIMGLIRGLVREIISTIGILIAAIVANLVSPVAQPFLGQWINEGTTAAVIVWVIIFFVVLFLLNKLGFILNRLLRAIMLGELNKLLGGIFGALKYTLIACLIITLLEFACSKVDETEFSAQIRQSRLVPYIHDVISFISPYAQEYIIAPTKKLLS